jgi:hypothetical protein
MAPIEEIMKRKKQEESGFFSKWESVVKLQQLEAPTILVSTPTPSERINGPNRVMEMFRKPNGKIVCPKCKQASGDDFMQCEGSCPMPMSPHYDASWSAKVTPEKRSYKLDPRAQAFHDRMFPCEPPCDSYGVCDNCCEANVFRAGYNFGRDFNNTKETK